MRQLTPIQVLTVLAMRLEQRARALEGAAPKQYEVTILELKNFAAMVRRAMEYTRKMDRRR